MFSPHNFQDSANVIGSLNQCQVQLLESRGYVLLGAGDALQQGEQILRGRGRVVDLLRRLDGTIGEAHGVTPHSFLISSVGQARRPLIRRGRMGPHSLQAQIRRVCSARPRWRAASEVGRVARTSCARGTWGCMDMCSTFWVRRTCLHFVERPSRRHRQTMSRFVG